MASYFQSVGCKFCNCFVFYSHGLASQGVHLHIKCNGRCFPVFWETRLWCTACCWSMLSGAGTRNHIQQYLWDELTCPCPWYLLLARKSSYKGITRFLAIGNTIFKTKRDPDNNVHGANMGPSGADRTQVGPMLAAWTLLSGWATISQKINLSLLTLNMLMCRCYVAME